MAGGRHPGWGTRNALSYFGLTYIEFSPFPTRTNCAPRRTGFCSHGMPRGCCRRTKRCFASRCAATTSTPPMTTCGARGWRCHRSSMASATIRRAMSSAGGSSPLMATPTGWSILCAAVGRRRRDPAGAAARPGLDVPHPLGDIVLEQAVFEVDNPQAVRDRWQALLGFPPQGSRAGRGRPVVYFPRRNRQPADRTGVSRRQPGA